MTRIRCRERRPDRSRSTTLRSFRPLKFHSATADVDDVPKKKHAIYDYIGGRKPGRPSLGALLVRDGLATEEQVKDAIAAGLATGERLGETAVRLGWATEERLGELLAEQWQLPFFKPEALSLEPAASHVMSLTAARQLGALPIAFDEHRVVVAIAEPSKDLFAAVQEQIGDASYVVVARSGLDSLLSRRAREAEAEAAVDDAGLDADTSTDTGGSSSGSDGGNLAEAALAAIESALAELDRVHRDVVALGKSLSLAREQLADQEAELEAAEAARQEDAGTIRRLESELSQRSDFLATLKAQVTRLTDTIDAGAAD